jgi:hypothetical protein
MPTEPPSLTPDERALAERLARLGPRPEPSPALDARVLAAARDAVALSPRRRSRWPAALGLAASLVLAVGVAWHLRPVPEAPPPRTVAMPAERIAPPQRATRDSPAELAMPRTAAIPAEAAADAAREPARRPESPAEPNAQVAAAPEAASKAWGDTTAAADSSARQPPREPAPVELPPPPPAPPAPPSPASENAAPQAFRKSPLPQAAGQASSQQAFGDEAQRAASAAGDEPAFDVPPATADSPAVRDAWLQRIQALVDAGDIAGAKASLHAFVRRYPDYTLPEDLRALVR